MGNQPHHMGSIGGGIDLSKAKTPNDADIKYMPIDNRASSLSPLNQSRKQLKKKNRILNLSLKHEELKDAYDMGQKVNEKKLFRIEDKLEKKSRRYETQYGESAFPFIKGKKTTKQKIGEVARKIESKAPQFIKDYFKAARQ